MQPRISIACPNCGKSYPIEPQALGANGRQVRCKGCNSVWFEPSPGRANGSNPVVGAEFCRKLKLYLNGLPINVKKNSPRVTHAIKTYLMREGLGEDAVGYSNGIKVDIQRFRNVEFMWDAAAKVPSKDYPGEDCDLAFVAESENQPLIEKILEDAIKLPIARADARLMFFRANEARQLDYFFERLRGLFERHRKSEIGDLYILAGMDLATCAYAVRRLTIRGDRANENPWQEV